MSADIELAGSILHSTKTDAEEKEYRVEDLTEVASRDEIPQQRNELTLLQRAGFLLGIVGSVSLLLGSSLANDGTVSRPVGAGACMVVVVSWWLTEAVPIAIASLVPCALFPLFGASTGKTIAAAYFSDPMMLFFGSVLVASAVERARLHERLARALTRNARSQAGVLAAVLLSTALCSAVVSNTTTTAMMSPLVKALTKDSPERLRIASALAVCYGSSCGGIATLTGTGVNLAYQAITGISFTNWSAKVTPIAIVAAIMLWLLLCFWFRIPLNTEPVSRQRVSTQEKEDDEATDTDTAMHKSIIPSWSRAEIIVLCVTFCMVLLWLTREGMGIGWSNHLRKGYATDGTVAISAALVLMLIPGDVLPWHETIRNFPWDAFFLLAGGVALARGVNDSGLDALIAKHVLTKVHRHWQLTAGIAAALTTSNFVSNVAAANLLLPLLAAEDADKYSEQHRDRALLLVTLACSFAFLFPISTPPNAIVFAATPELTARHFLQVGSVFTIICVLILVLAILVYL